jgi:hypothetical protein
MNLANKFAKLLLARLKSGMVRFLIGKQPRIADARKSVNAKRYSQKMLNKLTTAERRYLAGVKSLPCGVCGAAGPSDAHHIEQHKQYLCIPLCKDCHQGSFNGIHGQQRIWKVFKKTELSVLNDTIGKLMQCK